MNKQLHRHHAPHLSSYVAGFALSIVLTLVVFGLASMQVDSGHMRFSHGILTFSIIALAIIQLYVQAVFFLHLSRKENDRHNLISFIFTVFIVLFIGVGTLWIMDNLNKNMTPEQVEAYMHKEN